MSDDLILADAIYAAGQALHVDACTEGDPHDGCDCGDWDREAEIAVKAALLSIEHQLRELIAQAIEALPNLSVNHFGTRPLPDLIRKDTAARIAGTSRAAYMVPLIKMRRFCADSQMQKVNRIASPIFFVKVTNPVGDDKAYAQALLKNWGKDTAFQLRTNMEVVTLDLTDNETALNTIHWLEGRIEAPFRGASNLDKEGGSIGGNAAAQKDESDDWVAGQRTIVEDAFESLLQQYLDLNGYDGYTAELQIAVKRSAPGDLELRQAQLGYQSRALSVNEVRERLGAPEISDEEIAELAGQWAAVAPVKDVTVAGVPADEFMKKVAAVKSVVDIDPVDPERYMSHEEQLQFLGLKHGKSS